MRRNRNIAALADTGGPVFEITIPATARLRAPFRCGTIPIRFLVHSYPICPMPESVETIVVGGGQAGLSMSYHLARRGREHIVLERGRIAERWHSERWDTLAFQFQNTMLRLPGYAYAGDDTDAFMGHKGVTRFITDYAVRIAAPLQCGVSVTSLCRTDRGRLTVQAGQTMMETANVVVATGPYQLPSVPPCSAMLPLSIHQVTASRYTRPSDFPPGNVLVVGSGGSGCQIAEDLREAH
jgi:putative flavoprotein involved in K+ transport